MLNIKKIVPIIQATTLLVFSAQSVWAVGGTGGIENPININSLEGVIVNVVTMALGLTAVLAVGFIVYGGFLYISAAGDESQIKKGKEAIIGAVIGIIVIGLAYAIVEFVLGAVGAGGGGSGGAGGGGNN